MRPLARRHVLSTLRASLAAALLAACATACHPPERDRDAVLLHEAQRARSEQLAAARLAIVEDRLEDAIARLDQVLAEAPDDATALGLRGVARARLGALYPAIEDLAAAVAIAPTVDGYRNLGLAMHQFGFYDRAEVALRAALELAPDDPELVHALAATLSADGRHAEAEPLAEDVLRARPRDPEAHTLHGLVLHGLGRDREAEAALTRALALDPTYHPALFNLARHYEARGRDADAAHLFRCYLELRPDAPDATKIGVRAADAPVAPCPGAEPDA